MPWLACCSDGCSAGLQRSLGSGGGSQGARPSRAAAAPWPAAPWPKKLYFVRHGQSEYNLHYEKHQQDPLDMWDAPLTQLGREQATDLQPAFARLGKIDLAVASPLTRAMQTCLLAVPARTGIAKKYEVTPLCSEHMEASCDLGLPASELPGKFTEFDFAALPEVWWFVPDEHLAGITPAASRQLFAQDGRREPRSAFDLRVDAFAEWLSKREEASIAVFAHADFFNTLLSRHFAKRDARYEEYWMKNCELLELEVARAEDLLDPPRPPEEALAQEAPAPVAAEATPAAPSNAALAIRRLKEQLQRESPELKPGQVAAMAAKRWKEMGPEERQAFLQEKRPEEAAPEVPAAPLPAELAAAQRPEAEAVPAEATKAEGKQNNSNKEAGKSREADNAKDKKKDEKKDEPVRKVDPHNGRTFTFEELKTYYKGQYSNKEIESYWATECRRVGKGGKGGGRSRGGSSNLKKAKSTMS